MVQLRAERQKRLLFSDLGLLLAGTLVVRILAALPMQNPGYMDAYYYMDGALGLYRGQGFNEPFIWNYLDAPAGIPHPSHLYWMPLSSILAYLSFVLFGPTYRAAQAPFILLSTALPVLSYLVAWQAGQNRRHAWCAGLFGVFSGFFMVYWATPDNFAPFAIAGAFCLLALGRGMAALKIAPTQALPRAAQATPTGEEHTKRGNKLWFVAAGVAAGLAHLARSDGMLLLAIPLLAWLWQVFSRTRAGDELGRQRKSPNLDEPEPNKVLPRGKSLPKKREFHWLGTIPYSLLLTSYSLFLVSYLLVMSPWFIRNMQVIGRPLSTAGTATLWLTDYDDLFSYNKELSLHSFLSWGWANILRSRLQGLWLNLQTLLAVDWMVALAPLGLIGVWRLRNHSLFVPAWAYGLCLYLVMSLGFTFPGMRGAMLHSSVALLPFLFAAAMDGLDALVQWVAARRRRWNARQAQSVFSAGLVGIAVLISAFLYAKALPTFRGEHSIVPVAQWINQYADPKERVLVGDPAAFYYYSGRECLSIPNGDMATLLEVAKRYDARYVILDRDAPAPLQPFYDGRLELLQRFQDRDQEPVYVYRIP